MFNITDDTALRVASAHDHVEIVDALLEHKADVNKTGQGKQTPLHAAVNNSHRRVVMTLLRHEADVTLADSDNKTPSQIARGGTYMKYMLGEAETDPSPMYRALLFENNVDKVIGVARVQLAASRRQVEEQKRGRQPTQELWELFGMSIEEAKRCTAPQRALLTLAAQTLQAEATRGPLDSTFAAVVSNLISEYSSS